MNVLLPISSNNNFNEENLQEKSVTGSTDFSGSQKEDAIDFIPKKKFDEKENQAKNQDINDEQEEEESFPNDYEEITQETKDLFSFIKSTGEMLKIGRVTSIHNNLNKNQETGISCNSYFDGYQIVGQGGQGRVLRLRNGNLTSIVVKLYEKSKEKQFTAETSILNELKWNSCGGLGISKFLVTPKDFGIVINGGVGSLEDFRNWMIKNAIVLKEKELLSMHMGLMRNYDAIRSISVIHRDIKPANIILHYNNLYLEIIDYGLADYENSKPSWPGGNGTRGFTKPDLLNSKKTFTKEELLKGDYYSIAVTLLYMTDMEFNLRSPNMTKEVNRSIERLRTTLNFKALYVLLKTLSQGFDKTQRTARSKSPNPPRGYYSGLSEYTGRFLEYMNEKGNEKKEEMKEIGDVKLLKSPLSQEKTEKNMEEELKGAADHYLENNEISRVLDCYNLIIKTYIKGWSNYGQAEPFFEKIYSIINSGGCDVYDPLLYSTLGAYSYLRRNFERAKIFLRIGIGICQEDKFGMLILLSNYGHICSERGYFQEDDHLVIENIHDLLKENSNDLFKNETLAQGWLGICKSHYRNFVNISNEKNEWKDEVLLTKYHVNEGFADEEKLIFIAFTNLCKSRSALLESLLEKKNKDLLFQIQQLCFCFNKEYFKCAPLEPSLESSLEIFTILLQFNNILQDYQGWDLSEKGIKELKEASNLFEKDKKAMEKLFEEETSGILFKIFLENNLLMVLTGFLLKFSESKSEKTIASTIVSDYLKIKLDILLQKAGPIEVCFPKIGLYDRDAWDRLSVLRDLLHSDFILNPRMGDIDLLKKIATLLNFQYRIQSDPSRKSKKYKMILSHIKMTYYSKDFWKNVQPPLIPETHNLESLHLIVRDGSIFDRGGATFEEILANKSLQKLSVSFFRPENHSRYLNDDSAKIVAEFFSSFKLLRSLDLCIFDGLLTAEGISFFAKEIKKLSDLKSLKLIFRICQRIPEESIEALVETIEKSSQVESLSLKFQGCKDINLGIIEKLKNKMNSPLRENINIKVLPTIKGQKVF